MNEKEYTLKNILTLIAIGVIMVSGIALLTGCDEPAYEERQSNAIHTRGVPTDATNVVIIGNNWYTFEWRGQCFLGRYSHGNTTGTAQLTRVECE